MGKSRAEVMALIYLLIWIPYIAGTRLLTTEPHGGMAVPLTGLQMVPVSLAVGTVSMFVFLWIFGWTKSAHQFRLGPVSLPRPTKWTAMAGVGAALILTTVPLSLTFPGVSIPFIQVLMRGDALIVAPLVDKLNGRKVHWYSVVALVLVAAALAVTIRNRGGLNVPLLCLLTIILNVLGYFLRLMVMTRFAKNADPEALKRYFVEEQLVAYPFALAVLGALAWFGGAKPLLELRWGFTTLWTQSLAWSIVPLGVMVTMQGVVAASILLNKRENTYCVPLERSASVIGGVIAAYVLFRMKGYPAPTTAELVGIALLIFAVSVLSFGPKLGRKKATDTAEALASEAPVC